MLVDTLVRVHLANLPTPLEPLPRLGAHLGVPALFVKRDDLTGLATGGNKARKLELLLADALGKGADTLVTCGAEQSNQARQTAAAAARAGLECVLVLFRQGPGGRPRGNWLLDELLGAEIRWVADKAALLPAMEDVAQELRGRGHAPYVIPYGASNALGAAGYVGAMEEIVAQGRFDRIVVASSSGGTQAGLVVGAKALGYSGRILGISIDAAATDLKATVAGLANGTAALLGLDVRSGPDDIDVNADYLGGGYGVVADLERDAIGLAARLEGLVLDPVYTARAFGALVDLVRRGKIGAGERVLFLHTGGTPSLFAYGEQILPKVPGITPR